jgi:hypothetical protein
VLFTCLIHPAPVLLERHARQLIAHAAYRLYVLDGR